MKLTKDDCVEIYYALDSQRLRLLNGDLGETDDDCNIEKWAAHLDRIMSKIGVDGEKLAKKGNQ